MYLVSAFLLKCFLLIAVIMCDDMFLSMPVCMTTNMKLCLHVYMFGESKLVPITEDLATDVE